MLTTLTLNSVRFLDIFQVTQALTTVLSNHKQLADMRRSWSNVDFESVRNQAALVCNCRHEDLVQLLEVDFVKMMDMLSTTNEPVRTVMAWADDCCDRLMGQRNNNVNGAEDRGTLSSRSVLIRWGYVTSQIMRDLVGRFVVSSIYVELTHVSRLSEATPLSEPFKY
jgi:regulatory factor X 1/2/3